MVYQTVTNDIYHTIKQQQKKKKKKKQKKKKRWGSGLQIGYGYLGGWYVGVGVSYNIFMW
jgi:hypothetical protein